ncbi:MAG: cysteine hydrolase [Propionibacteriaceae bacterium]|jgi:nicotinamidase-related amidase|nr:cysteine hydrolase [Propionibacteriaceae bacterium]
MNPDKTALVLIEFQNDFTSPGGALHDAVKGVMETTGTVPNAVKAVAAARAAGVHVVHCPISFAPGYGELDPEPYGILAGVVGTNAFVQGQWGSEIVADLTPAEGDIVIAGKRGLDAFWSSDLDFVLRQRSIETVVLAGYLTNCCVESTMRTAYEKHYEVYTLTDAVAATSQEEHDNAIKYDYPMFSKPVTVEEFADILEGADAEDTSRGY